jgi:hypothetical protein
VSEFEIVGIVEAAPTLGVDEENIPPDNALNTRRKTESAHGFAAA